VDAEIWCGSTWCCNRDIYALAEAAKPEKTLQNAANASPFQHRNRRGRAIAPFLGGYIPFATHQSFFSLTFQWASQA
jgi:hypothetical protein